MSSESKLGKIPQPVKRVKCGEHGRRPGYAICKHIIEQGAAVRGVTHPHEVENGIGSIVCDAVSTDNHTADDLVIICADCAEKFLVQVMH